MKWFNVTSNTHNETFYNSLLSCESFKFEEKFSECKLGELKKDAKGTCLLKHVAEPF